jgi:hypothetical protein
MNNNNSKHLTDCDYCNYCDYCDYCDSCDSCNYCYSCYYCRNLRMTEYNLFCYAENYNDENSFQQKRYRAFNKKVGEKRYCEIRDEVKSILKGLKLELNENT